MDAIYCSPLERARETATPIAAQRGLKAKIDRGLLECEFEIGPAPNRRNSQSCPSGRQCNARQRSGSLMARVSLKCRFAWCRHLIASRAHPGGTIAGVSHADPIKAAVAHAVGTHLDLFQRIVIPHARYQLSHGHHTASGVAATTAGPIGDLALS